MQLQESVIETKYGRFVLNPESDSKMATNLARAEYPQQDTIDLALAFNAKYIVDVGAHVGTVSVPLARDAHVVAFEPNKDSFKYLARNIELNGVEVDARRKGLSDEVGRASSVVREDSNAGAHTLSVGDEVEISTLNQEVERADFIKVDVEGMEPAVLRGAHELILRSKPVILFEMHLAALRHHGSSPAEMENFFIEQNYELYVYENKVLYNISNLSLTTFLITPRSYVFGGTSAVFDIVAVPRNTQVPFPVRSGFRTLMYLARRYISLHYERLTR